MKTAEIIRFPLFSGANDVTRTHDLLITNVSKVVNSSFSDAFYRLRIGHKEIRKQAGHCACTAAFSLREKPVVYQVLQCFLVFFSKIVMRRIPAATSTPP